MKRNTIDHKVLSVLLSMIIRTILIGVVFGVSGCMHHFDTYKLEVDNMRSIYSYCVSIEKLGSEWDSQRYLIAQSILVDEGRKFWGKYSVCSKAGSNNAKSEIKNLVNEMGVSFILASPYGKKSINDKELYNIICTSPKSKFWKVSFNGPNEYEDFLRSRNAKISPEAL